jgi:hypothetical protein
LTAPSRNNFVLCHFSSTSGIAPAAATTFNTAFDALAVKNQLPSLAAGRRR